MCLEPLFTEHLFDSRHCQLWPAAVNGIEVLYLYEPFSLVSQGQGDRQAHSHIGNYSHKWYFREAQVSGDHLTWRPNPD